MTKRSVTAATLSAALALGGIASAAVAQDEPETTPADESAPGVTTGIVVEMDDGYYLDVDGTLIKLEFGPSWFDDLAAVFGDLFDEAGELVGDEVEIQGQVRNGPNEHASDVAKAKVVPKLRIKSVNGNKRSKGKPAWAGGPQVAGDAHPGFAGRAKGQSKKGH